MAKITEDTVSYIAHLARLNLSTQECTQYTSELNQLLALVEQMDQVATDDIQPLAHPLDATQRLREDQVTQTDQRDLFQQNAPQVQDGLYLVPQVIEDA